MKKTKLSKEARRIAQSTSRYVEVQACPGSGKTTAATARVAHLLRANRAAEVLVLSHSNTTVDNFKARLRDLGLGDHAGITVLTCHACALRTAGGGISVPTGLEREAYDKMLRQGTKAVKKDGSDSVQADHLIVDEYQDCSALQLKFIVQLARHVQSVVVLGDRQQVLYGFAGVAYTPLESLIKDVTTLPLSTSFRLTRQTADLAQALSRPMGGGIITTETTGKMPRYRRSADSTAMAKRVAASIRKLVDTEVSPSSIAVLGRNRSTVRPVALALRSAEVPSTLLGAGDQLGERLLELIRVVEAVEQHLPDPSVATGSGAGVRERRARYRDLLGLALEDVIAEDDPTRAFSSTKWKAFVSETAKVAATQSRHLETRYMGCVRAYLRLRGGVRADKELRNYLNAWQPMCRAFGSAAELHARAVQDVAGDAVTVTTIHQAKGMEWDYVFVVGVTDGVLPDSRSKSKAQLDEERRILYVAVTRARQRVYLHQAPIWGRHARQTFTKESRFMTGKNVRAVLQK
ncbi:ATP-dependent helicase [Variovorax guangxiensis]|uniref:DNA 3'-5' helicase II n=1 Tax=Variovorax guangxiensis TaxID=1775474 RepID=A0A3S0XIM6_9BURK|nr:ATP-dependent helicase [Variovorax guangxiensis]RUR70931.1 ATP-dependent helicase [Variovorax guangxiensis]